jgi:YedE family putative selenium metabolism protein
MRKTIYMLLLTGGIIGAASILLMTLGNPKNMGICAACFIRDIAGGLGLDNAAPVQYIRPEILGFVIGAFVLALAGSDFKPSGGSSPLLRFVIAFFVMFGALVFLGCPLRMILRLSAGDLNALVGLLGFVSGIAAGSAFLKKGFSLGRSQQQPKASGYVMPALAVVLLIFLFLRPSFIKFSAEGPGSMHAPALIALAAGLVIGALAQRSRMCMAGGIRDVLLIRDSSLLSGYVAILVVAFLGNLAVGNFKLGFEGQPIAHTSHLWNFLGMCLAGYGSALLGGCPLRQIIMAGEGNADAGICVLAFLLAGATAHNFGIAASASGVPANGQIAVVIGFVTLTAIALLCGRGRRGLEAR